MENILIEKEEMIIKEEEINKIIIQVKVIQVIKVNHLMKVIINIINNILIK
jgi:hypothetical protein